MKIKLQYEITEFTEDDALDFHVAKNHAFGKISTLQIAIIDDLLARKREMDQDKLDEHRRWARFMHFCHTGVML